MNEAIIKPIREVYRFVVGGDLIILIGVLVVMGLVALATKINLDSALVGLLFFVGVIVVLTLSLSRELPHKK